MGQLGSKKRDLFIQFLKITLKVFGCRVPAAHLECFFLQHVQEVCPWFPEEGTLNPVIWKKVGNRLIEHYNAVGPSKVPVDTFSLWNSIRDSLDPNRMNLCHLIIRES